MITVSTYRWSVPVGSTTVSKPNTGGSANQGAILTSTYLKKSATFVSGTPSATFDPSIKQGTALSSATYKPSKAVYGSSSGNAYCTTSFCGPKHPDSVLWLSGQGGSGKTYGQISSSCITCIR